MRGRVQKNRNRLHFRTAAFAFALIFLLLELAAFNTGENLLYLLAAFALGFPVFAGLLSVLTFRGLGVVVQAPDVVHRNEPFSVIVRLQNLKQWSPIISMSVAFVSNRSNYAYVPMLAPGLTAELRLPHVLLRRGVHALPAVRLSSGFPMGLVERARIQDSPGEVVVYPRVHRIDRSALERLDDSGNRPRPTLATGDEFYSLREYVPGDDIRFISWRVSARLGELIVRELEPGSVRSVVLVVDTRGVPASFEADERFELAVEMAASLAVAFLDQQYSVALVTPQGSAPLGTGEGHVSRVLDMLARVTAVPYETLGDDWYRASGDLAGATKICVATDAAQWGSMGLSGSVHILDPEEVLHAS